MIPTIERMYYAFLSNCKTNPVIGKAVAVSIVCVGAGYLLNAVTRTVHTFRRH